MTKTFRDSTRPLSLAIYILIVVFFVVLYSLMTMTAEDVSQYLEYRDLSVTQTVLATYHYLPRVGEFYQNLIIRYYEPVAHANLYVVPRLMDACFEVILLYFLAWMALLRRPKCGVRSALAIGILFIFVILTRVNETILSDFASTHNYVLGYLLPLIFCIPFAVFSPRIAWFNRSIGLVLFFLLGFLTGYSTEVSPLILLLILVGVVVIQKRNSKRIQGWMICGLGGLFVGIILFFAGGGLNARVHGEYANTYDYVFKQAWGRENLSQILKLLLSHALFNARYLWPMFLLFITTCIVYFILFRRAPRASDRSFWISRGSLTFIFLLYSITYLAISSVIRVEDDLYSRYMVGIYFCAAITIAQLADATLLPKLKKSRANHCILSLLALFILTLFVDMFLGFHRYNIKIAEIVRRLDQHPSEMKIKEADLDAVGSPIFGLYQSPFLESYVNNTAFGVKIQYIRVANSH